MIGDSFYNSPRMVDIHVTTNPPGGAVLRIDLNRPPQPQGDNELLLYQIVRMLEPKIVAEIGILYGQTTVLLVHAMPSGGRLYALDVDTERARPLIEAYGYQDRIILVPGDSKNTAQTLPDGIGFAYIDGDHDSGVNSDAEIVWPKMLSGGIVAFHDANCQSVADAAGRLPGSHIRFSFGMGTILVQKA